MLANWIVWLWGWVKFGAESTFIVSAIGSLAGAWGGAYAIQRLTERAERRERLRKEVNHTNVAIGEVYSVMEKFVGIKGQYLASMWRRYNEMREIAREVEAAKAEKRTPQAILPAPLPAELTYEIVWARINLARLERLVLEDLNLLGRAPAAASALAQSVENFDTLVKDRLRLIGLLKEKEAAQGVLKRPEILFMLGLPQDNGGSDMTFKSNLSGMVDMCDESIQYCRVLYKDLSTHGDRMRERYLRRFRGPIAAITKLDFSTIEARGLFPDPTPFNSWETSFLKRLPETDGRRCAKWWYVWRKKWRWLLMKPWWRGSKVEKYRQPLP